MEFILFFFGLFVGSFLNVVIDRLSREESIIYPPSHCDHCNKKLVWYDLIPVVSYILLGGKCRYCKKNISLQYPIAELLTGLLFALLYILLLKESIAYQVFSITYFANLAFHLFIVSSFIIIFFTDLKYGIIPDKIVFPTIVITFIFLFINNSSLILNHLIAAFGALAFFLAIYLFSKGRGMGFGDVKFSFALGLIFGYPAVILVLYIAFLTGAIFSIILIVLRKKQLRETIVFGPFLVLSAFIVLFFGSELIALWDRLVALP